MLAKGRSPVGYRTGAKLTSGNSPSRHFGNALAGSSAALVGDSRGSQRTSIPCADMVISTSICRCDRLEHIGTPAAEPFYGRNLLGGLLVGHLVQGLQLQLAAVDTGRQVAEVGNLLP